MMRMLQLLGYEAKWVVDWADHVWCEVHVDSSSVTDIQDIKSGDVIEHNWVHLDPCEASVDEPLIYQGWGKNQTYIVSYSTSNIGMFDINCIIN
jgi:peptide-N4-(N-acetyl-beta-glucosaminyl)asparagine amidase